MQKISYILCVLIGIFGISSWISVSGLWLQTPLLVQSTPEKWDLPSQIAITIQIGNLGSLLYLLLTKLFKDKIREAPVIYIIITVGFLSCIFLAIFWKETVYVLGAERSIPFLVLTFFLATVDCMSSLVYLPYLASYTSAYLTALYVGEGCSGLAPGIVALIQGGGGDVECVNMTDANGTSSLVPVNPEPLLSVQGFFIFLAVILFLSFVAFLIVDRHPELQVYKIYTGYSYIDQHEMDFNYFSNEEIVDSNVSRTPASNTTTVPSKKACLIHLITVGWIAGLIYGFLPSIQSYSMIPYGNMAYHLGVTLSNILNPLACFLTFFWKVESMKCISFMTFIGTVMSGYMTYLAFASPTPPLVDNIGGKFLVVATAVSQVAIFSYTKASIALELQKVGKYYLRLCGLCTQVGALIGAIISFLIVDIFHLLKQAQKC